MEEIILEDGSKWIVDYDSAEKLIQLNLENIIRLIEEEENEKN